MRIAEYIAIAGLAIWTVAIIAGVEADHTHTRMTFLMVLACYAAIKRQQRTPVAKKGEPND